MDNLLIDTDVILDFFFDREPFADSAAQTFSLCESGKIKGFITPVICSNTYYLLRQTASHAKVIDKFNQLMTIMEVLSMDRNVIIQALNSGFKDFVKSDIGVLTPDSYLKSLI